MSAQKLIVFNHSSELGNAPANKLFDLIKVEKKENIEVARSFSDYTVSIDETGPTRRCNNRRKNINAIRRDDMLMLSGIQHFMFCQRQWALIHIEQQWSENKLTTGRKHITHKCG
jgi:hypothetical protein